MVNEHKGGKSREHDGDQREGALTKKRIKGKEAHRRGEIDVGVIVGT